MTVLANIPIWVFPLFILLLVLGLRASRDRRVPLIVIYLLPLLGILTLRNILSLAPPLWVWLIAALCYGLGIWLGMRWQQAWIRSRSARHIEVKGEWVTLSAMMLLFLAGFAKGFVSEVAPQIEQSLGFINGFTALVSLPAGQFLGRALAAARWRDRPDA